MGWIIGISLIFILAACIAVGWKSLLICGVVGGVLYALYQIVKKSEENEATDADKKLANISLKIVAIIAVSIIMVGGILFLVGIITPQHTGYRPEVCGYCGGSGRLTSGKECGLCDGAGGAVFETVEYGNYTWLGVLLAASGAILLVFKPTKKQKIANVEYTEDKRTMCVNTPAAVCYISYGHWYTGLTEKTWVFNNPDSSGCFTVRCDITYTATKNARKVVLYVQPRNEYGNPLSEKILLFEDNFSAGYKNSITWKNLWQNQKISEIRINKIKIYFKDDTIQET